MLGRKKRTAKIDSLIGQNTEIHGDIVFTGGLHVDGKVIGNVEATDPGSLLTISDQGTIEGEVKIPNIILNGQVIGDVHATERVELAAQARVNGNVFYNLIEMAIGAEVNGKLVHRSGAEKRKLEHMPEKDEQKAQAASENQKT